ncbi:MAG: beta-ketoacyl-ACP synthase [Parahaliea sp.]
MYYLNDLGILCNLGRDGVSIGKALLQSKQALPAPQTLFYQSGPYRVGGIPGHLPGLPASLARHECRNNRLALAALTQLENSIEAALSRYGRQRIGVVMATSTAGIDSTQQAVEAVFEYGSTPVGFDAIVGTHGGLGEFVADYLQLQGPVFTLSTACSSSGNALLSARRLLRLGLCDAVITGGVDTLCELTLQGFGALEAQSATYNRPFATCRDGINIGEAAGIYLLSREPSTIEFKGGAGSSDAHHISAPHPQGDGAFAAMYDALIDANLNAGDIGYLNLHGTGTFHNDSAESRAVNRLFGQNLPCSSTKAFTGHCLGAASALESGICWLLLNAAGNKQTGIRLPPSAYPDERDDTLAPIALTGHNERLNHTLRYCMSNSFAFGGNNVSIILGRSHG